MEVNMQMQPKSTYQVLKLYIYIYIIITLVKYIAKMIKAIFPTNIYIFRDKFCHFSNKEIGKFCFYSVKHTFFWAKFCQIANFFYNLVKIYCFLEILVAKFRKKYNFKKSPNFVISCNKQQKYIRIIDFLFKKNMFIFSYFQIWLNLLIDDHHLATSQN